MHRRWRSPNSRPSRATGPRCRGLSRPDERSQSIGDADARPREGAGLRQMNPLAQRIAIEQQVIHFAGAARDHGGLQAEPEITDPRRKAAAQFDQRRILLGHALQNRAQSWRGFCRAECLRTKALRSKRILRNINAVEVAIIGAAILQMINDLERGAKRVRGGPGGYALAMHVENEAPDRRRRISAIV